MWLNRDRLIGLNRPRSQRLTAEGFGARNPRKPPRPDNGEIFYTLREAKILIERWRVHYNRVRPHSALGYRPPAPEATLPVGARVATLRRPQRAGTKTDQPS
jgi:transposase InsO family protein